MRVCAGLFSTEIATIPFRTGSIGSVTVWAVATLDRAVGSRGRSLGSDLQAASAAFPEGLLAVQRKVSSSDRAAWIDNFCQETGLGSWQEQEHGCQTDSEGGAGVAAVFG